AVPVSPGGSTTLYLADDVTKGKVPWQKGDWIAVATTSFSPFETEFVQLASDPKVADSGAPNGAKSVVTVTPPPRYYHFGRLPPTGKLDDDDKRTFGVDERAEVGLISRNVKLTATISPNNIHWGGDLKILVNAKEISIQGVEIEKFGKDQLGRYPIHFHQDN